MPSARRVSFARYAGASVLPVAITSPAPVASVRGLCCSEPGSTPSRSGRCLPNQRKRAQAADPASPLLPPEWCASLMLALLHPAVIHARSSPLIPWCGRHHNTCMNKQDGGLDGGGALFTLPRMAPGIRRGVQRGFRGHGGHGVAIRLAGLGAELGAGFRCTSGYSVAGSF